MGSNQGSCPFDETVRASTCRACCNATDLPPCVTSWLMTRTGIAPVTVLRVGQAERKAA